MKPHTPAMTEIMDKAFAAFLAFCNVSCLSEGVVPKRSSFSISELTSASDTEASPSSRLGIESNQSEKVSSIGKTRLVLNERPRLHWRTRVGGEVGSTRRPLISPRGNVSVENTPLESI